MTADLAGIKGRAILFSEMTPPDGREAAFNDWYDNHHTPSHVRGVPGFLSAMRYRSPAGPHYLAVYELSGADALDHEEYKKRKLTPDNPTYEMLQSVSGFTRYIAVETFCRTRDDAPIVPLDAPIVLCVFFSVPLEQRSVFESWYDDEHIPMLFDCPDWLMVRRFDIVESDPEPYTHLILHYLNDAAALRSDAFKQSYGTPRGPSLAAEPWFKPLYVTYLRRNKRFLKSG